MWRVYFKQTMVTREKTIVWQTQMRIFSPTDQKGIGLVKGESPPFVRASQYFEINLHRPSRLSQRAMPFTDRSLCHLPFDLEIVESDFRSIARIKPGQSILKIC